MFEIRKKVYIINTTTVLLNKLLNKEDLTQNDIIICENSGKGNCFYKSLSQFYTNKETYHIYYRKETCKSIENKKEIDKKNYPFIYVDKNNTLCYEDYFNNMILTGTYAGQYELFNAAIKFKCNLFIYRQESHNLINNEFRYKYETLIVESEDYNPFYPLILLGWAGDTHYELLLPLGLSKEEYPIEVTKNINLTKNIDTNLVNGKNNNFIVTNKYSNKDNNKKLKNEKINTNNGELNKKKLVYNKNETKLDLDEEIESKYEEALKNFLINENSIYPKIEVCKNGETRLEDIFNF